MTRLVRKQLWKNMPGKEERLLKLIRNREIRDQLFVLQKIKFLQSKGAINYVLV